MQYLYLCPSIECGEAKNWLGDWLGETLVGWLGEILVGWENYWLVGWEKYWLGEILVGRKRVDDGVGALSAQLGSLLLSCGRRRQSELWLTRIRSSIMWT